MDEKINLDCIFKPSEDNVVAREIQGEFIIVPIISGIGDMEDEIFTLNETGKAIWQTMDGQKSLKNIAEELAPQYNTPQSEIEKDILGITQELLKRKMLIEIRKP